MVLGWDERHRRAGHDVGDRRQLLGRRLGRRDEAGNGVRGGRQQQHPADDPGQLVEPIVEAGHDAEVAPATADRPEQVGMVVGVDLEKPSVGGDDLGAEQIVDRQTELAHEIADAATDRDPADPDRSGVAEPGRQAVRADGRRVFGGGQPALGPRRAAVDVDVEALHVGHVEHDPALAHAVPRRAVAAAPDGQLHAGLARERDDANDVLRVRDLDDDRRVAIDVPGHDRPGGVVVRVVGPDHAAVDGRPELRDQGWRSGCCAAVDRVHETSSVRLAGERPAGWWWSEAPRRAEPDGAPCRA